MKFRVGQASIIVFRRIAIVVILSLLPLHLGTLPAEAPPEYQIDVNEQAFEPPVTLGGGGGAYYGGGSANAVPVATTTVSALGGLIDNVRPSIPTTTTTTVVPRIALISSGVNPDVFPFLLDQRVDGPNDYDDAIHLNDPIGYGTYAASVLFQLATSTMITSLNVYQNGMLSPDIYADALGWVYARRNVIDAVLIAIPPSEYLDPITSSMASGGYDRLLDSISSGPASGPSGPVFGIAMDQTIFDTQGSSGVNRMIMGGYRESLKKWDRVHKLIKQIESVGIGIAVPAGDLGPNPQSLFGVANMTEVITVGGFKPSQTVSPFSSSGPSIELKVKPDLVATTGITGLMPDGAKMANYLRTLGLSGDTATVFPLEWAYDTLGPAASERTLLDSTVASAATVAIHLAAMRSADLAEAGAGGTAADLTVDEQRGALYARSTPIPSVPVWRQGQGALGGIDLSLPMPSFDLANGDGIALGHGDLGLEPPSGSWSVDVPIPGGAVSATVTKGDAIGVTYTAKFETSTSEDGPTLTVEADNDGITVSAPVDFVPVDEERPFWCGYVKTNVTVRVEDIPVCLMQAFTPIARTFGTMTSPPTTRPSGSRRPFLPGLAFSLTRSRC